MKELSCIVVEDEAITRKLLENLCKKNEALDFKQSFENGTTAIDYLKDNPVDLILLDVEMPDMKGWELLDSLSYIPLVIVISSNKEYAYDAFQYKVVDFIPKPVTPTTLDAALVRAANQYESRKQLQKSNEIYVKANGKLLRLDYDHIFYIENLADYVKIYTSNVNHVIYCTMKHLENRLPSNRFMKVHRSYIINLGKIEYIEDNDLNIQGKLIPIARSQKSELLEKLNLL